MTETQTCGNCRHENESTQRFCGSCGRPLFRRCPSCAGENPPQFDFCGACGRELAATPRVGAELEGERRWVSVLFGDLAGFTWLSEGTDPEEIRLMVHRCTSRMGEIVDHYGGWLDKVIGDAVMAVFGAPMAHEDDAERAVRAGLELQRFATENSQALAGLRLRIGVDSGEVMFAPVGPEERRELTVMGDAVNTASRLQEVAPLGEVLVGEQTRRACEKAIQYEPVEPIALRGKAAPVRAWLAKGIRPIAPGGPSQGPLLGRDLELEILRSTWERVVALRRPHLLSLLGEPGIGKTAVCDALVAVAAEGGARVVRGRSLPYGDVAPYRGFAEMVESMAGIADGADADEARETLRRHLERLRVREPQRVLAHLMVLTGLAEDVVDDRLALFSSARQFIEASAQEHATLLVFEDVHWADPSLLDLIEWVAAHLHDVPAMALTVGRPELLDERGGWGGAVPRHTAVSLDPLPADAGRALALRRLQGISDAEAAAERIEEVAGGNPLFVEELAAATSEGVAAASDPLPVAIRGIIAARLDALPDTERRLLWDASVAGGKFSRGMLECLAPEGSPSLSGALEDLEFRDLIRRRPGCSEDETEEFCFKHALIREVAYATLPHAARRERHAALGAFLEATPDPGPEAVGLLAHHWHQAGAPERAIPYLLSAAEQADRGWACEEALDLYNQTLELLPEDDAEARRELELKRALAYARLTHLMADWPTLHAQREAKVKARPASVSPGNPPG